MAVQEIIRYLIEHPDAKDTIQGILRWWLPHNPVERREEEVQEALEFLVAKGWVTQRQTMSSQKLYGLKREKLREIQVFLRESGHQSEGHAE